MLNNNEKKPPQRQVNLTVRNEVKLDPKEPIPIQYNGNSFRVVSGRKYIPFIGHDDNFPNLLLEARLISTTQNACITSIARSVVGKGLMIKDVADPETDFINWTKSVNNKRQSFNKLLTAAVDGERTQGNQFVEVVRGEIAGKKYLKLYLHSMLNCRLAEVEDNEVPAVIISREFSKKGVVTPKKSNVIPLWSPDELDKNKVWKKDKDGSEHTMLHFKNEVSGVEDYGLPASVSGLRYQVLEGKSAQYNIDNFDNNMVLGGMLIFKSSMTSEEAQTNAQEILLSHVGEGKTGRIAVLSSEEGIKDVEFIQHNTQKEGSFMELDKRIEEKIITANGWDSTLAGINRNSALGNGSTYIRSIFDVKEAVLLKPLREELIDAIVSPVIQIYADWFKKPEMLNWEFSFQSAMPFSFMADLKPETFMKVGEARDLAGLEPDEENGNKYLSEMNKNVQTQPDTKKVTDNA